MSSNETHSGGGREPNNFPSTSLHTSAASGGGLMSGPVPLMSQIPYGSDSMGAGSSNVMSNQQDSTDYQ